MAAGAKEAADLVAALDRAGAGHLVSYVRIHGEAAAEVQVDIYVKVDMSSIPLLLEKSHVPLSKTFVGFSNTSRTHTPAATPALRHHPGGMAI